ARGELPRVEVPVARLGQQRVALVGEHETADVLVADLEVPRDAAGPGVPNVDSVVTGRGEMLPVGRERRQGPVGDVERTARRGADEAQSGGGAFLQRVAEAGSRRGGVVRPGG